MTTTINGRLLAVRDKLVPCAVLAAAALILLTHPAAAQTAGGTGSLTTFLPNVANLITGTAGQAIAVIAVALTGMGAMFGAVSARNFGFVVLGCAIVFSAAWIVGQKGGLDPHDHRLASFRYQQGGHSGDRCSTFMTIIEFLPEAGARALT